MRKKIKIFTTTIVTILLFFDSDIFSNLMLTPPGIMSQAGSDALINEIERALDHTSNNVLRDTLIALQADGFAIAKLNERIIEKLNVLLLHEDDEIQELAVNILRRYYISDEEFDKVIKLLLASAAPSVMGTGKTAKEILKTTYMSTIGFDRVLLDCFNAYERWVRWSAIELLFDEGIIVSKPEYVKSLIIARKKFKDEVEAPYIITHNVDSSDPTIISIVLNALSDDSFDSEMRHAMKNYLKKVDVDQLASTDPFLAASVLKQIDRIKPNEFLVTAHSL